MEVDNDNHLGNFISNDNHDRNIDFNAYNSGTLDRLHSSFCMHMYGCELWNFKFKLH